MKFNLRNFVTAGILVTMAAPAFADDFEQPIGLRLGLFTPNSTLKGALGREWFGFGLDYRFIGSQLGRSEAENKRSFLGLTVDYMSHGRSSNLPIALTYNYRLNREITLGAGPSVNFYNSDPKSQSGSNLGAVISATWDFGGVENGERPVYLQAKYFIARRAEFDGIGVFVGFRF
jgi:hypothetical protein